MDLFSVSKEHIKGVRKLSDEEFSAYDAAVTALREFDRAQGGIGFVQQSHFEFEKELSTIEAEVRVLGGAARNRSDISLRTNLRLLNFLSAVRLYLDHTAFRLSRAYGRESPELALFHEGTNAAYDGSFAYRFLYKLRNFGQHCGMPIGHAGLESRLLNPPAREAKHELKVCFHTQELLAADRAVWGTVAGELEESDPELEVAPLVREAAELVLGIHRTVVTAEEPHLREKAAQIHEIVKDGFQRGGTPVVGEMVPIEGGATFNASVLPVELMVELGYTQYKKVI